MKIGPQQGKVLNAGLWVQYRDNASGQTGHRFSLGLYEGRDWQGYENWRLGFAYWLDYPESAWSKRDFTVQQFAFFMDVWRENGEVVRLWQSRRGQNYRLEDAFSLPGHREDIPYGHISWADQASPVFHAKHACGF